MDHRRTEGATINRTWLPPWVSVLTGAGILVLLGHQLGTDAFRRALGGIGVGAVLVALGVTAATTWCCARRWSLLAKRLRVGVSTASAFRACYRAQFLNSTLPGGIVGEVDRAVWHGYSNRAMSRGIRSVVWDRVTGQVVLFVLVLAVIPTLAPAIRTWLLWLLVAAAVLALLATLFGSRFARALWAEARDVPGAPGVWSSVVGLSALAVAGHVVVFVVAARAVDVPASTLQLVPLALVILQASAIPLGVAGWGPREGAAALVFGASDLGAGTGLAVSVAYGVLATIATLPGVLALRRRVPAGDPKGGSAWASAPTQS